MDFKKHFDKGQLYTGCSNVVLPVGNKTMFPPAYQNGSRLTYYASLFNSLEINSSFYKIPLPRTVDRWVAEVPEHFKFTFKLWQNFTHNKGVFNFDDLERYMEVINHVGAEMGSLLVQFPPSFRAENIAQLENLLSNIRQADQQQHWQTAVEFRHISWYNGQTYNLLDRYQMGMVLHDLPASAAPLVETDAYFIYLRFHGPEGGYRGSYTDDFLYEYATYISDWLNDDKTVYVYFNNTMGQAVHNLVTLNEYLMQ